MCVSFRLSFLPLSFCGWFCFISICFSQFSTRSHSSLLLPPSPTLSNPLSTSQPLSRSRFGAATPAADTANRDNRGGFPLSLSLFFFKKKKGVSVGWNHLADCWLPLEKSAAGMWDNLTWNPNTRTRGQKCPARDKTDLVISRKSPSFAPVL